MTEEEIIEEIGQVFQQVASITKLRLIKDPSEASAIIATRLIGLLGQQLHSGDEKAQARFIKLVDKEVVKAGKDL